MVFMLVRAINPRTKRPKDSCVGPRLYSGGEVSGYDVPPGGIGWKNVAEVDNWGHERDGGGGGSVGFQKLGIASRGHGVHRGGSRTVLAIVIPRHVHEQQQQGVAVAWLGWESGYDLDDKGKGKNEEDAEPEEKLRRGIGRTRSGRRTGKAQHECDLGELLSLLEEVRYGERMEF
ncbi:hypothetical protein FB446DRAFT_707796 [Lentinula raphanica]|nr:hypothetical protein FB446DRAFT_707796 [Lentinula raphanica]